VLTADVYYNSSNHGLIWRLLLVKLQGHIVE